MGGRAESVGFEALNNRTLAHRMLIAASSYYEDADILAESADSDGDGSIQLRILSLEIFLKCARLIEHGQRKTRKGGHDYSSIWSDLSPSTQTFVLQAASARAHTSLNAQSVVDVLKDLQCVFELARYPYELLADEAEPSIAKRGADWQAAGQPLDQADFRFHPEETMTLVHGLRLWVDGQLN